MGKTIALTASDGHKFAAYRADPKGKPKGGIVVIQEIFGVNAHIREVADSYAAEGYAAIAPAIFDRVEKGVDIGYDEKSRTKGREVRAACNLDNVLLDIAAAIGAFKTEGLKIGVVGYCWGGSLAWVAACRFNANAAVGYYGGQIIPHKDEKPKCPVMLHFGNKDQSIPMSDVEKIIEAHPEVPVYVYDAGHGFNCNHRADYNEEAARAARKRTMNMFAKFVS
ncbi:MAG: dienelactone hydrolase family protein [Rhodospirillales bacterium]|nr:dienelactone hydrolase family protein [Rhodospirillales bacterium]